MWRRRNIIADEKKTFGPGVDKTKFKTLNTLMWEIHQNAASQKRFWLLYCVEFWESVFFI